MYELSDLRCRIYDLRINAAIERIVNPKSYIVNRNGLWYIPPMSKLTPEILLKLTESFSQKSLPRSEVELSGEVPYEHILPFRAEALKEMVSTIELPGFRKGKVPESMALARMGETAVLEEAANHFLQEFYPALVLEKKLDAVGRPDIRITKLAAGNPVALTIKTAVYPEVKVPTDYKKIAAAIPPVVPEEVTDKEYDEALEQLRKSRAGANPILDAEGKPVLPELTDEFAQSVGSFKTLEELKEKLREGITEEKKRTAKDKRRGAIIEALLEKTSVDMPQIFVESEIEKMLSTMRADVARFGMEFEDYLKRIEKTEEALREELKGSAEKRAKMQLMLNELANRESITPDKEDVEREFGHALEHFPDADKEGLRIHITTILRNEKVLQMLEAAS
jgi:FKBP-type peptidyl-prolyl cis-trans isomerase (trigger factor)